MVSKSAKNSAMSSSRFSFGLPQHKTVIFLVLDFNNRNLLQRNSIEIVNFKKLARLFYADLSHNNLTSIHGFDETDLRFLNLAHNKITRLGNFP